jgi:hypothetical protein
MSETTKNRSIYDDISLLALSEAINDTDTFFYRKVCRFFSHSFNVDIREVWKMDPALVLREYYESRMEKMSPKDMYDAAVRMTRPDIIEEKERQADDSIKQIEEEERQRKATGGSLMDYLKKAAKKKKQSLVEPELPKESEVLFDDLPDVVKSYGDEQEEYTPEALDQMTDEDVERLVNNEDESVE